MRWGYDFGSPGGLAVAVFCALALVAYAAAMVWASVRQARATRSFGEPDLLGSLTTHDATTRRALKSVLLVVAMLLAFFALARPEFGSGTRIVPATNLDVVIVLDYSKSMYARDVVPSRIARAKAEVARLIQDLPGARFGAVAFAGEPMSFPLTSDGAAIAQFFRQLEPNDMPVGGTATARALERGRELFARDPKSKDHVRIIVLVTDGEDLEGDPVNVAESCRSEGTRIDVVQIGGRAPEVIPDVRENGKIAGNRLDDEGKPLTTQLSADGEAQLARIAQTTGGTIVRAEHGDTGIDQVARSLQRMMRDELSERVETVYAEEYAWPLAAAVLLLVVEALIGEAPRRGRGRGRGAAGAAGPFVALLGVLAPARWLAVLTCSFACATLVACGWNPSRPFDRDAPPVRQAIGDLDAGDAASAASRLEDYLSTGACKDGNMGTPDLLKRRPDGTFDLALSLFQLGEQYGRRFGEEETQTGVTEATRAKRHAQVECARRLLEAIADDPRLAVDLRARAHYLDGNLAFLDGAYEEAVRGYDRALVLAPGEVEGGDDVGRDAAWNRAIALRRLEDQKDAGSDSGPRDAGGDGSGDGGSGANDAGKDTRADAGEGPRDAGTHEPRDDSGAPPPAPDAGDDRRDAGPSQPPPSSDQDERMLEQLENAPTLQQEEARRFGKRRVRGMADK
ncbi:MAG TPA: VWA domain-containing protein [Polyangiaceae bacterium]|nr:VWA domain-containing protein [Polyangiaceae bacterium]